jgi:hypothetical protein
MLENNIAYAVVHFLSQHEQDVHVTEGLAWPACDDWAVARTPLLTVLPA